MLNKAKNMHTLTLTLALAQALTPNPNQVGLDLVQLHGKSEVRHLPLPPE